jgi:hypothetical protein
MRKIDCCKVVKRMGGGHFYIKANYIFKSKAESDRKKFLEVPVADTIEIPEPEGRSYPPVGS